MKSDQEDFVGCTVVVNDRGDLYMEYEARKFIGESCVIEKKTKGGLYLVRHPDGTTKTFAKRNINLPIITEE